MCLVPAFVAVSAQGVVACPCRGSDERPGHSGQRLADRAGGSALPWAEPGLVRSTPVLGDNASAKPLSPRGHAPPCSAWLGLAVVVVVQVVLILAAVPSRPGARRAEADLAVLGLGQAAWALGALLPPRCSVMTLTKGIPLAYSHRKE